MKKLIFNSFIVLVTLLSISVYLSPIAYAAGSTLSLSPVTGAFNKGCSFTVNIKLDTGGVQTDGTDAILLYDPSKLSTTTASIAAGTIYPEYSGGSADQLNGKVTISGLAPVTSAFAGQGTLATVAFTVNADAAEGPTKVRLDFDPSNKAKTTDSNVLEHGTVTDILSSVTDGSYTIGTGTNCTTGGGKGGVISTPSAQPKNLDQAVGGKTGSEQLTFTVAIVGSVLTVLGILGLALL